MTKHWIQCEMSVKNIDKGKYCDKITNFKLTKHKFNSMWKNIDKRKRFKYPFCNVTVPVKEDYRLVVYHCDIKNNK